MHIFARNSAEQLISRRTLFHWDLTLSFRIAYHKTGYDVMLLHWLCVVSALLLLLYGSRLLTIYTVMTSVCETVVGIAARRPSVTLFQSTYIAFEIGDDPGLFRLLT